MSAPAPLRLARTAASILLGAAVWTAGLAPSSAQTNRWAPLPGIGLGDDVSSIQVDQRGLIDIVNHNADDDRPYPAALVLIDFTRERDAGMLGSYRSLVHTIAVDCAGRRAQNVQDRLYAQPGGVERTAVMGTLSLWKWDPKQATHPAVARAVFAQVCKNSR